MNKEEAVYFAGLMEDYLNIPSFLCESIENNLVNGKYKEVIEYIIKRKKEEDERVQFFMDGNLQEKDKIEKLSINGKDIHKLEKLGIYEVIEDIESTLNEIIDKIEK